MLSKLFQEKTPNFENLCITRFKEQVYEKFEKNDLVYLTPDSPNALSVVDPEKVYVIGGFVDDNIKRNTSLNICLKQGIGTACLPIADYFAKPNHKQEVLTINQVFELLFLVYNDVSWKDAFDKVLPRRKGYVPLSNKDEIL